VVIIITTGIIYFVILVCSALQRVALRCSALQYVAVMIIITTSPMKQMPQFSAYRSRIAQKKKNYLD